MLFQGFPGDMVGTLGVLTGEPSFFTIRAKTDSIVAIISKSDFYRSVILLSMLPSFHFRTPAGESFWIRPYVAITSVSDFWKWSHSGVNLGRSKCCHHLKFRLLYKVESFRLKQRQIPIFPSFPIQTSVCGVFQVWAVTDSNADFISNLDFYG